MNKFLVEYEFPPPSRHPADAEILIRGRRDEEDDEEEEEDDKNHDGEEDEDETDDDEGYSE
jgi:hypothetical protein